MQLGSQVHAQLSTFTCGVVIVAEALLLYY